MTEKIDVIIPTFNRGDAVCSLVHSLKPLLRSGDTISIIWQGLNRPHVEEEPNVSMIHLSPPSLTKARNLGIHNTSGDIILFLDDDVAIMSDILQAHRKGYGDSNVGAIAGKIDDPLFPALPRFPFFDIQTGEIIQNYSSRQPAQIISLMGAHMSFRRTALVKIGGFDTNFKGNALWEEVDCAFRLREAGYVIVYAPDAHVKHLRQDTGGCRTCKRMKYTFDEFRNTSYFAARFSPPPLRKSWLRFWLYRLEYKSRSKFCGLKYSPHIIAAGIMGASCGILAYATSGRKRHNPLTASSYHNWISEGVKG